MIEMSTGKYSKGGKKLCEAISISSKQSTSADLTKSEKKEELSEVSPELSEKNETCSPAKRKRQKKKNKRPSPSPTAEDNACDSPAKKKKVDSPSGKDDRKEDSTCDAQVKKKKIASPNGNDDRKENTTRDSSVKKKKVVSLSGGDDRKEDTTCDSPAKKKKVDSPSGEADRKEDSVKRGESATQSSNGGDSANAPLLRPSYLDDEDAVDDDVSEDHLPDVEPLPNFVPIGDLVVVVLPYGSSFSFKGKLSLTLITGRLHCLGYVIGRDERKKRFPLFSPDSVSLLTVEDYNNGVDDPSSVEEFREIIEKFLSNYDSTSTSREQFAQLVKTYADSLDAAQEYPAPSVAILERLDDASIDAVVSFSGLFRHLFAEKFDSEDVTPLPNIGAYVFRFSDDSEPSPSPRQRPTIIPTLHWKAIEKIVDDAGTGDLVKVVVAGGKNCGKSTFARVTINALLSAKDGDTPDAIFPNGVFYLDADVGQCEFTPSSFVSLVHVRRPVLGPPFTHLATFDDDDEKPTIVRMAFGGGNSPGHAPSVYLTALKRLYIAYEEHPLMKGGGGVREKPPMPPPLIVNTMGWNKGLGLTLMVDTLRTISPSHVIQLDASTASKNFPPITTDFIRFNPGWRSKAVIDGSDKEHKLISIFAPVGHLASEGSNKYRPPDFRLMALLAHWSEEGESVASSSTRSTGMPAILATAPYKVPLRKLTFHVAHSKVKNSQILNAFNGNMVALGIQSTPVSSIPDDPRYLGPRFFTSSSAPVVEAVGLGLVRGVDLDAHEIYVSTFVDPKLLLRVDTLFMGDMDLPAEIRQAKLPIEILPTRTLKDGVACGSVDEEEEDLESKERNVAKALPYMTIQRKTTIGSEGLGRTHKAPFRESGPKSVGRRNDLIKW